jgi:predicted MFS family arabinose efflux permease
VVGLLWLFTGKEHPRIGDRLSHSNPAASISSAPPPVPFRQAFTRVVRIKEVWIIGLISLTLWGANMGFMGYLPLYLRNIGWSPAAADGILTAFNGAFLAGSVPMVLLANRLRAHKGMLFFSMVVTASFLFLIPAVTGPGLWPLVIVASFLRSSAFAVSNVLLFNLKGVGSTYGGTGAGLQTDWDVGSLCRLPWGISDSFGNYVPFFFWGGLAALSFPLFLFLRESKPKPGLSS